MKTVTTTALTTAAALAAVIGTSASASIGHFEGFEDPGFTPGGDNWNNYDGGEIERVATGYNSIASSDGTGHAIITNLSENNDVFDIPSLGALSPYTRLGGYSSTFGSGFTASLDIYLDTAWTEGQGFDYSVALNNNSGDHLRDYMFHVGVTDLGLLVNGSNNTDRNFNDFKLENENGGDFYTISASGWYTFQQDFYDDGGTVSVDLSLLDSSGTELWSVTRTSTDATATSGGNRYGWFTYNNIDELAIDNTSVVPEPGSIALLGLGGLALIRRRRRA